MPFRWMHTTLSMEQKLDLRLEPQKFETGTSGKNKFASYLFSMLDQSHLAIIQKGQIPVKDAKQIWETLNNYYEMQDVSTRFHATQKLMTIGYRDLDHTTKTFLEFGNRVVDAGNQLKALIPDTIIMTPAVIQNVCATDQTP